MRRIYFLPTAIVAAILVLGLASFISPNPVDDNFVKTIVIDAGHGGHDHGCSGSHSKEKHVALSIALKLGSYIEKNFPDVKVIYTRKTDVFVELHERAAIANRNKADLFISIHCNASVSKSPYGTETYVMGLHKNEANLSVAKRENASILLEDNYNDHYEGFDPNSPTAHIIFTLFQNAYLEQSILLAEKIEYQFKNRVHRKSRGVKQAGFLVLYKTTMPSVLIETGFLTNNNEEQFLNSAQGQDYMASAIYRAFKEYKKEIESTASQVPDDDIHNTPKQPDTAPDPDPKDEDESPINDTNPEVIESQPIETTIATESNAVVFKVQFLLTNNLLPDGDPIFSKLAGEEIVADKEDGLYKYRLGNFSRLSDAIDKQAEIRLKGFKDAFTVAFHNGKRISINEAKKLTE